MKRLFTILILYASLCASAVGASLADLANGYYRISNDFTNRYIQVVDNTGSLNYQASTADMGAIRLLMGLENVISDPASVLYLEKQTNGKYDIKAQNTGIYDIIKSHVNIIKNGSTYWANGAQSGISLYLWDALGAAGDTKKAESGLQTAESKKYPRAKDWNITPIDNSTENYFGITPTVTYDGKYYQPFYASFPFSCASEGMRVLYVTKIDEAKGELLYKEIKGTVPALTPVIIECSSLNPADNKLNIGGKGDPITDNKLKGVLFDSHIKKHENFVKYDASTMRLLGNTAGGNLGGVVANLTDVPRNTIYVPVSKAAPAEFVLVDASNMPVDVESISLNETSATINVGETLALSATVLPENATNKTVTWKSSDESIATVDAAGKVTAIKAGKATITAASGAVSAACEVKVIVPVVSAESISLSETSTALKVGETMTLKATVLPDNTTDKTVAWTSSDATVAKIDASGKVTALAVGNATITATCGAASATCAVTVEEVPVIKAESIELNEETAKIKVGETFKLTATVLPADAADKTVTWTSSDATVAKVDASGKVTALAVGNATITATCGAVSATCAVTVEEVPVIKAESIELNEVTAEIKVGESFKLTATVLPADATDKTVTWTSSDATVAKVDASGKVTALAVGNATITATCGAVSATCAVTVEEVPVIKAESIELNEVTAEIKVGETFKLTATVLPADATDKTVTWTSSDESVAVVNAFGRVTAVSVGTATITATCGDVSSACTITVVEVPVISAEIIELSVNNIELKEGDIFTLYATVLPEDVTDKTLTWASSDESVAIVNDYGKVTAIAAGNATITVTCGDVSAACTITVVEVPVISAEIIELSVNNIELKEGDIFTLYATVLPEDVTDKTLTWASSDESVAIVNDYGNVTAVAAGNATITVTCGDVSATCSVTVVKEEPKEDDKEFMGIIDMGIPGDDTTLNNQKLAIKNISDDHCTIALYHFNMGDGVELGDIIIENVVMTEANGVITYRGSKKDVTLAGGAFVADVECEGTENADGIITIDINVLWKNGDSIVPIKVIFTNDVTGIFDITAEDAPAEYYHINGVKATGLTPGLYIKVQGGKTTKVLVK